MELFVVQLSYDNGVASLVMSEAFPKNGGLYSVVAKNTAGEAQCSATVSVKVRDTEFIMEFVLHSY